MGTLSKNFDQFGRRIEKRVGGLKANVSHRLDEIGDKVGAATGEEGVVTRGIERVTAALPSGTWLALAGLSIVGSLGLKLFGQDKTANFVGQWAPTLLLLGVYNKLVKLHGSERFST